MQFSVICLANPFGRTAISMIFFNLTEACFHVYAWNSIHEVSCKLFINALSIFRRPRPRKCVLQKAIKTTSILHFCPNIYWGFVVIWVLKSLNYIIKCRGSLQLFRARHSLCHPIWALSWYTCVPSAQGLGHWQAPVMAQGWRLLAELVGNCEHTPTTAGTLSKVGRLAERAF